MTIGGYRPGAGRRPKAEKHESAINNAEGLIRDKLPQIVEAQIALALGVTVKEVDDETGTVVVYTRPPDLRAGQYLMDRIMGRPIQRVKDEDNADKMSLYGQLIHALRLARGDSSIELASGQDDALEIEALEQESEDDEDEEKCA